MRMALRLGARTFGDDELLVMAVINRTPDSFFDRGATFAMPDALAAVDRAVEQGADIVDIGGVKAGPGPYVDVVEEIRRTAELVRTTRKRYPQLVISVDTWRAEVAAAVLDAGADVINDAWGGVDDRLAGVAARAGAGLVCTHAGGAAPRSRPHRVAYDDVVVEVRTKLQRLAQRALDAGVHPETIMIDPGHDFGKNTYHSLELTRRVNELAATGWPVLVALSNKDFLGETLDLPVQERLEATLAATAISAWLGARIFRVHQVRETRRVLDTVASIHGTRPPAATRRGLA